MWQDNIILNNTNISKFKLWKRMVTLEKLYFIIFFYLPAAHIQPHVLMKKTWKWFVKVFWESEKWRLSPPYADNLMYVWKGLNLKIEGYSPTTLCACTKLGSLDFHGFLSLFALVCWVLKFVEGLVRVVRIGYIY
jgi:hypothetical protein